MRKLLRDAGLADEVLCDSAGIIGYHAGEPPDARMRAAGIKRGLPMTGVARQVTRADLDSFDLVLAMDYENFTNLVSLSTAHNRHKIKRFCEYCRVHSVAEVPDPYYGGASGFEQVLDLLDDGCSQILSEIKVQRGV